MIYTHSILNGLELISVHSKIYVSKVNLNIDQLSVINETASAFFLSALFTIFRKVQRRGNLKVCKYSILHLDHNKIAKPYVYVR